MDNTAVVADGVQLQAGGAVTVDAQADYNTITQALGDAIDVSKDTNVGAAVGHGAPQARAGPVSMCMKFRSG